MRVCNCVRRQLLLTALERPAPLHETKGAKWCRQRGQRTDNDATCWINLHLRGKESYAERETNIDAGSGTTPDALSP